MRRRLVALVGVTALVGGCTGGGPPTRSLSPAPPMSTPIPSPPVDTTLPLIVLTAVLSEEPARWDRIASIPYGQGPGQLGMKFFSGEGDPEAGLHRSPASFAVAEDGSFWILDTAKGRLAHFTARGAYVGEVSGLGLERGEPRGRDIAVSHGTAVYVLEEKATMTTLRVASGDSLSPAIQPRYEEHEVVVPALYPSPGEIVGALGGFVDPLGGGPRGFAELDVPGTGQAALIPGVPVGADRWIDLHGGDQRDLEVEYTSAQSKVRQPIRVDIVTEPSPRGSELDGALGPGIEAAFPGAVGVLVRIIAYTDDRGGQVGQMWYLRIGTEKEPLVWERLPDEHVNGELKTRHLAAGPDGSVYLMLSTEDGEEIYRRP